MEQHDGLWGWAHGRGKVQRHGFDVKVYAMMARRETEEAEKGRGEGEEAEKGEKDRGETEKAEKGRGEAEEGEAEEQAAVDASFAFDRG